MQRLLIPLVAALIIVASASVASAQSRSTTSDNDGTLTMEVWPNGKIRASYTDKATGQTETRDFESPDHFQKAWPEMAKKVDVEVGPDGSIRLGTRSGDPDAMPDDMRRRMEELRRRARGQRNAPLTPDGGTANKGTIITTDRDGNRLEVRKQADGSILVINDRPDGDVVRTFNSVTDFVLEMPDLAVRIIEHLLGVDRRANDQDSNGNGAETTPNGQDGTDGQDGADGQDGTDGRDGQDGADGQDGSSGR